MEAENDKAFKDFVNSINFLYPKEIPSNDEKKAYVNLKKENPSKSGTKKTVDAGKDISNQNINDSKDSSSKYYKSSSKISSPESPELITDNSPKDESEPNDPNIANISHVIKKMPKKEKKKRFGQHENYSFFEAFTREMIFQIFNYHLMYFFGYEVKKQEINQSDKKDKEDQKEESKKKDEKIIEEKEKTKEKSNEETIEEKAIVQEKTEKKIIKKTPEVKIGSVTENEDDKNKELISKEKNIKNLEIQKQIDSKTSKIEDKKDGKKKDQNEIWKKDTLRGDIDFLLPDLTPNELKTVLFKEELAPFIFYDNINPEKNSDLIGEIKENIKTGDKKHISQLNKYRYIFQLCQKNDKICNKFGLKKENQKILVYVFNF